MFKNNPILLKIKKEISSKEINIEGVIKYYKKNYFFLEKKSKKFYKIPLSFTKKVMYNDKIIANISKINNKKIAIPKKLISPFLKRFIGRISFKKKLLIIIPDNYYINNIIFLNSKKNNKFYEGDWILAEMKYYPLRDNKSFYAKIISFIASKNNLFAPWFVILKKYNLDLNEPIISNSINSIPKDKIIRKDLTKLNFITIDNSNTKDIDDAVYIYKNNKNEFILNIAISDSNTWIKEGSELDFIAKNRGFTNYLPGFSIPMLPRIFSDNLCSLKPNEIRPVLICKVKIHLDGKIDDKSYFFYAWIKSKAKLDYENVSNWLENKKKWNPPNNEISNQIILLNNLAKLRIKWRKNNESIFKEKLNYYFNMNKFGSITNIFPISRRIANYMIEESMIIANICAARILKKKLGFGLYNVHKGFNKNFLKKIVNILKKNNILVNYSKLSTLSGFCKLRKKINNMKTSYIDSLISKFQTSSYIKIYPEPHFGLGLEMYATWTSPIRRYSDIINHRLLYSCIYKKKIIKPSNKIIKHLIECKKKNKIVKKNIQNWLYARFLKPIIGKNIYYKSEIFQVINNGIKVKIINNGAMAFIPNFFIKKKFKDFLIDQENGMFKIKKNKYLKQGDLIDIKIIYICMKKHLIIANIF
ncbi:exoribonuclease II [Sodalis-like secondary symbiont of Drepanosiphum platanoidis]|uniref:exoribonuclease II n=1 Tax=Sodalis-like secondary symbiont of Drepanosiphum platanoidis TaxID=2994493 RepID=UPI0034648899